MIIPIERLQCEAAQAARHYSDINDACPYPFHTDAAHAFKAFFQQALTEQPCLAPPALARLEGGAP